MTSTLGTLRRGDEMDAGRARHLRKALHRRFDVLAGDHHQVGHLVDDHDDIGHRIVIHLLLLVDGAAGCAVEAGLHRARQHLALGFGLQDAGIVALDVAHAELRHALVALLHLAHRPFERDHRLLRVGHDRREQMRDAVIDRQLEHLRIDHDEFALVGRQPVEQRQDHGVDADRLARAGGAGDEKMRHARQVGDDRLAADILAERKPKPRLGVLEVRGLEQLAQQHDLAPVVGKLDADGVAARDHGDAGGDRAHRAGDVVGKPDHARGLGAGRGLELVERDHGAGAHIGDLAFDAEILEHAFELARILLQHLV